MAVSRTILKGLNASLGAGGSASLVRASAAAATSTAIASSSKVCLQASTSASFSTSAHTSNRKLEETKMPFEKLEKHQDNVEQPVDAPRVKRTLASFSMQGKTCVITGAARGLGNTFARAFIESGANKIAFLDLNADDCQRAAADVVQWFEQHSQAKAGELDCIGVGCNIADEASVKAAFDQIYQHYGSVDVVVNSAGIVENYPGEQYPTPNFKRLMSINVDGAWFVANEAARRMIAEGKRGASIVLIASMSASIVNYPQLQAPYNSSKAAVKHMAKSLGVEWAKHDIRVNSLSPGYCLTNLTRVMIEKSEVGKQLKREWETRTPMGRMADPEDMKGACVFLASDASRYVTSSDLTVDGGYTAL